jgi:hypothetical protein
MLPVIYSISPYPSSRSACLPCCVQRATEAMQRELHIEKAGKVRLSLPCPAPSAPNFAPNEPARGLSKTGGKGSRAALPGGAGLRRTGRGRDGKGRRPLANRCLQPLGHHSSAGVTSPDGGGWARVDGMGRRLGESQWEQNWEHSTAAPLVLFTSLMGRKQDRTVRFGVGDPSAVYSSVYRVWGADGTKTSTRPSDVYLTARLHGIWARSAGAHRRLVRLRTWFLSHGSPY